MRYFKEGNQYGQYAALGTCFSAERNWCLIHSLVGYIFKETDVAAKRLVLKVRVHLFRYPLQYPDLPAYRLLDAF
jgi:hypothetical protein